MTRSFVADVIEFHTAFGLPIDAEMTHELLRLRADLVDEEHNELQAATGADIDVNMRANLDDLDDEGALDALVDLVYVAIGFAVTAGWDFDEAWRRVHAANMAKLGPDGKPILRADGKCLKPRGWVAPDLCDCVKK